MLIQGFFVTMLIQGFVIVESPYLSYDDQIPSRGTCASCYILRRPWGYKVDSSLPRNSCSRLWSSSWHHQSSFVLQLGVDLVLTTRCSLQKWCLSQVNLLLSSFAHHNSPSTLWVCQAVLEPPLHGLQGLPYPMSRPKHYPVEGVSDNASWLRNVTLVQCFCTSQALSMG